MNNSTGKPHEIYGLLPLDIEGMDVLAELALDLRWSWNHAADELWQALDPVLWKSTHSPWIVLQASTGDHLERQLGDPGFREKMKKIMDSRDLSASTPAWFQRKHAGAPLTCVAYFSMEFMLSEALPIYVGGLGNVAGDQLKSASDLGVPVVAVGLLYQQGYFRQQIDNSGWQQASFPYSDPGQLPIAPLRLPNGDWLRLKVSLSGYPVWLRTWQVQVGRVRLYLLDSNDVANLPIHRRITSECYGGGPDLRIQQEIVLGIGGWRLLRALGISPEVCHMNEGHAAFLVLERASDFMKKTSCCFDAALAVTRAGNLFTTHTAVAAGFDHFSPGLMWQFFGDYARDELKIDFNDLMALGRQYGNNDSESLNMAYLAVRGSGAVNGVSRLHGSVSRKLFESLFPRWPKEEVPVGHVTNGVHMPSWDSEYADEVWTEAGGKDRWKGEMETLQKDMSQVADDVLWQLRTDSRTKLVGYIRERFEQQLRVAGRLAGMADTAKTAFDPHTLTLGFARRFVPYKRPDLLLHDPERLIRLLTNPERPIQLVIAGKAPPFDDSGKALIQQWVQFIEQHSLFRHVLFLDDYDMLLTEQLVQGVDLWINTPRRPWEACGTSGMKVLVNGGLNLSELDGWWVEAYTPELGWALGDGREHGEDRTWDTAEAVKLYELLEREVAPEFYMRNEKGIPGRWVERMRKSMATLTPQFSANRSVREYTDHYYLPGATNFKKRAMEMGAAGKRIAKVRDSLRSKWRNLEFVDVRVENAEKGYLFQVTVSLNGINAQDIAVELYAEGEDGGAPVIIRLEADLNAPRPENRIYRVRVESLRPAADFTARIIPHYEGVLVPLEDGLILWQR
jgi:starch phosphorylase